MKKLFLLSLLTISSSVFAQTSVSLTYGQQKADVTNAESTVRNISIRTRLVSNVDGDVGIQTTSADTTYRITNRYEAGLSGSYNLNSVVSGNIRGALGQKQVSGSDSFEYFSVEPGINAKFGNLGFRLAYRYRDAFDNANADKSNTTRYSVSYDLSKKDRINVGYDVLRGDGANTSTTIGYVRSF